MLYGDINFASMPAIKHAKSKFSTIVKKNGVKWSKVGNLFLL
jgi:hypothetical protein